MSEEHRENDFLLIRGYHLYVGTKVKGKKECLKKSPSLVS
jgi:hypothetical protein